MTILMSLVVIGVNLGTLRVNGHVLTAGKNVTLCAYALDTVGHGCEFEHLIINSLEYVFKIFVSIIIQIALIYNGQLHSFGDII